MIAIEENKYKLDFEIADRYISFSSELLRLSLTAISALGTLLYFSIKKKIDVELSGIDKVLVFITIMLFTLAAMSSLAHRFYATDTMSYHITYLRTNSEKEKIGRRKCLKVSENFLIITEYLFGGAVLTFVFAIYNFVF